jgi:hypothetical protein
MTRLLPLLAALAVIAGCAIAGFTSYKQWTEAEGDDQAGIARLSYEYRKYESPQVDERAGVNMARERCAGWGYKDAQRKGEDRACIDGEKSDCSKWRVIREYRCTK